MIPEKRTAIVHSSEVTGDFIESPFSGEGKPKLHLLFAVKSAGCTEVEVTNLNPWVPHRTRWLLLKCAKSTLRCAISV